MATQNFEPIHFTYVKDKIDGKSPLLGALFFFCIFLITFLFVYFLYVCTHRRRGSTATHPDGSLARSRSPAGLDAATISSLPIFSYGSSANGKNPNPDSECAICLSIFQEGEKEDKLTNTKSPISLVSLTKRDHCPITTKLEVLLQSPVVPPSKTTGRTFGVKGPLRYLQQPEVDEDCDGPFRQATTGGLSQLLPRVSGQGSGYSILCQLIQQLVSRTVHIDKLYELLFSVQGHLTRFGLQEYALVTGLGCDAFLEGAEYERLLERRRLKERTITAPQFNASGDDSRCNGHVAREDSDEETSEEGSSEEQISSGDEKKGTSGSDHDGEDIEDTGESDGDRSSADEDTHRGDRGASSSPRSPRVKLEIEQHVSSECTSLREFLATLIARAGPTTVAAATSAETEADVSGSLPKDVGATEPSNAVGDDDDEVEGYDVADGDGVVTEVSALGSVPKARARVPTMRRRSALLQRPAVATRTLYTGEGRRERRSKRYKLAGEHDDGLVLIFGWLVAMLAELGHKGGFLKLVGIVALLWGGLRGSMSLTDKLISFMRITKHPMIPRILGFVFMVLLLWSPVVIPLLPSLIQSWATRSPFTELLSLLALPASTFVS
ncbi:RING-H2 finger ATL39-like [Olea europaea subsp. europaea]|uniref:RING-H2 finger ATL39-like n=1 Tax=Olea europaea subsp. europaea TaxID=158383 RepID=A0A8S0TSY3_OLEEU|nr:RING-H2 finger ATL39-like [Olea europaea subsp. europaea]